MTRRPVKMALVLTLAACVACGWADEPKVLRLDHAELLERLSRGLNQASISYTLDRVVIRGRIKYAWLWFPVRAECVFVREAGRVRIRVKTLLVSGRLQPGRIGLADSKLARLVDEETDAARVEVKEGGGAVYAQKL